MQSPNYDRLMELMNGMEIVDTHEHLGSEANRVASKVDFSTLFSHYCTADLHAAGMSQTDADTFFNPDTPVDEKWRLFEPYYNLIRDGGYSRAAHMAMEQFYGVSRLESLADAEAVTKAIRKANKPGLYKKVLKDACHIRVSMNYGSLEDDPTFFAPVIHAGDFVEIDRASIRGLEDTLEVSCGNLSSYVDAVYELFRQRKEQGMRGIKFALAYERDLHFAPRTHAEAEQVFLRVAEEGYGWRGAHLGYEEMRPFQDYMVHRFVEMAGDLDIPIVFHTGMQHGNSQNADDTRPLRLWNLPHRYRRTDFVILHAGFPWLEEAAMLAKHFPNVYLDMAWTHLMSQEVAARYLQTWVDLVPMNKIFGFGGDYIVVEKVYGHLTMAKQDIARAFTAKIENGGLTLDRAEAWVRAMLWDNPKRVFRLEI